MDKLKVVFCGRVDPKNNKSWSFTNQCFLEELKIQADVIGIVDYSIDSKFLKLIHKLVTRAIYGGSLVRDPFMDILMELKFKKKVSRFKEKPDLFIHSSDFCVPVKLMNVAPHIVYSDATVMGGIRFNNEAHKERVFKAYLNSFNKYSKRLNLFFTFNEWSRVSLICDFNIEEKKIFNIGFGANLNPYFDKKDFTQPHIMTVLRKGQEKNKGLYLLLDAFKIAKAKVPDLKLSVIGTTAELASGVTYYEGFPREKTIELFQQASLFAMPALFEPNGMVYIEALACRTPILGLNRLAFPEFCGNGNYGFIADENPDSIAEKLLLAMSDPKQLEEMALKGQEFVVGRYSWKLVVKKMLDLSSN